VPLLSIGVTARDTRANYLEFDVRMSRFAFWFELRIIHKASDRLYHGVAER
jgi:hypothetical protein